MVDSELSYLFIWILLSPAHILPHPIVAILCMFQQLIFEFLYR